MISRFRGDRDDWLFVPVVVMNADECYRGVRRPGAPAFYRLFFAECRDAGLRRIWIPCTTAQE